MLTAAALHKRGDRSPTDVPPTASRRRFVILVPAHNEEAVIGTTMDSFRLLDYPHDQFQVHVVADNCTDGTVDVVRRSGFNAHVRIDMASPGKGPALNWLLDRLLADGTPFDTVLIVDADTTVHTDFLRHMAAALDGGARAAQAYYGVHDADGSTAAALRSAALACRHNLRPLGRSAIGASCGLYGNGMAFDREVMKGRRWSGHLTEDMEFQMDLLLDGQRVAYVAGAVLEAEMPHSLTSATSQNERWELGRQQMARRYIPTLARRLISGPGELRAAHADAIFDHLVPPLSVLIAANMLCGVGSATMTAIRGRRIDRLNLLSSALSATVIVLHVTAGLRSVDAPRSTYKALLHAPQMIAWKLKLWSRVLARPSAVTWTRTTRNVETT
ncbi:MAG TPA: glycosyltransferase family 2 protein [Ilumatobacteraceae bacterium]|nr:glycosyltransferase family 2 protein [Ilumatobacteraceae bacterium]